MSLDVIHSMQRYCSENCAHDHQHIDPNQPGNPPIISLERAAPCVAGIKQTPDGLWGFCKFYYDQSPQLLSHAIAYSSTLQEALDCFSNFQETITNAFRHHTELQPDGCLIARVKRFAPASPTTDFLLDASLDTGLFYLINFLRDLKLCDIDDPLRHTREEMLAALEEKGLVTLLSRDSNGSTIKYSKRLLHASLPTNHFRLRQTLLNELDRKKSALPNQHSITTQVERLISEQLEYGANMEGICDDLAVARRTLSRQLKIEGTSFTTIREGIRRNRALELLQLHHIPIKRVAAMCGYHNVDSFNRSVKIWTGDTPAKLRQRHLGESESQQ